MVELVSRRSLHFFALLGTVVGLICTGCVREDEASLEPDAKSQKILADQGFDTDANTQEELAYEMVAQLDESALKSQ